MGGVATGSMKASEAEMVQGNMTYSGCILMAVAWIKHITKKGACTHFSINLSRVYLSPKEVDVFI